MTSATDPLDLSSLPSFGGDSPSQGRVRSSFSFGDDEPEEPPAAPLLRSIPTVQELFPSDRPARSHKPARAANGVAAADRAAGSAARIDWQVVTRVRVEVARRLADQMGDARWDRETQEAEGWVIIRKVLDEEAADAMAHDGLARDIAEQEALGRAVFDACFGLGRLQPLVDDESIENILVSGHDNVTVERADGTLWRVDPVADSDEELADFLAFLAARADNPRSFTPSAPSLHMTLPGGARLAAARDTARISVVIRRHRVREVTLQDMVAWETLSPTMASFLRAAVRARLSIVVSGAQGAGKTTLLRALCAEIGPSEVLGTFESEYELFLHEMREQHHTVFAWESREGSGERGPDGRAAGSRTIAEQIIDSFRFRLDRQILGEIRGAEVWSMVKLMESGSGSISTTHAATAHQTMRKLITCAMEAGPQISQELAATKLADTIDVVVQLACDVEQGPDGSIGRKHRYVEEILQITPGERARGYAAQPVFRRLPGECAVANIRPDELMEQLVAHGFDRAGFEAEMAQFATGGLR